VIKTSVVICTRNRSAALREACLGALACTSPDGGWELVVVDNASTDDTLTVARAVEQERADLVRVVQEAEVGLSAARNAGIRSARGELILFLDDDALPAPGWVRALAAGLGEPRVLCAGGPVEPVFRGELPVWFSGRYLPYLTVWDLGPKPVRLAYNEYPRGANIGFRREAFDRFGPFSPHLGRRGASLLSCEETELCLRLERGGGEILYVPEARVRHLTNVTRLTPRWLERRFAAQGRSEAILTWRHAGVQGLFAGVRASRRRVAAARRERAWGAGLYVRCHRRSARGYLAGMVTAPLEVPRYRPPSGETAAPWRPPG
jgi:glycosyltransferase involved in cell wall biosynthesis